MKIKVYITGFFYLVTLNAQSNMDNIIIEGEKYNLGGFFNVADDGIDMEVFTNIQNKNGLYGSMWLGQIDYYSNTNLISNFSLGLNKLMSNDLSIDVGLGSNINLSNQLKQSNEVYLGIDMQGLSIYSYYSDRSIMYESWYKPEIDSFYEADLDILFYGSIQDDGYEFNCNISSQLNDGIIGGIILGYESFEEEIEYQKQNNSKSFKVFNNYNRISVMAYLGFLFN